MFYNTYFTKSVYFEAGIIWLNKEQDKCLRKIYEETVASRLGLGKKFLRDILYVQQKRLEIGLVIPRTVVAILAFKLYIGKKTGKVKDIETYRD